MRTTSTVPNDHAKHWLLRYILGIALILLGVYAVYLSVLSTLLTVLLIGGLLFATGIIVLMDTFFAWRSRAGFWPHFLVGAFYLVAGLLLMMYPAIASLTMTWILAVLFIIVGVLRMFYAWRLQLIRWEWAFFNGLLTTILGVLILSQWPVSGLYVIGLFVGIDLIFAGWAYLSGASAARLLKNF